MKQDTRVSLASNLQQLLRDIQPLYREMLLQVLDVAPCTTGNVQQLITARIEILPDESNEALSFGLVIFGSVNLVIVTWSLGEHEISSMKIVQGGQRSAARFTCCPAETRLSETSSLAHIAAERGRAAQPALSPHRS
jgi:hypothetical protein